MITYLITERTPTDATRQQTHRFIAEGVRPDWWKTTSHDPHETPGVVQVWWKKRSHHDHERRVDGQVLGYKRQTTLDEKKDLPL